MSGPYNAANEDDHPFSTARAFFANMEQWLCSSGMELTHDELEEQLKIDGHELMRLLFQDHLELRAVNEQRLAGVTGDDGCIRTHVRENTERALMTAVSYTHLRAHETRGNLVCRLLLEKKK